MTMCLKSLAKGAAAWVTSQYRINTALTDFAGFYPPTPAERCGNIATYLCGFCADGGAA